MLRRFVAAAAAVVLASSSAMASGVVHRCAMQGTAAVATDCCCDHGPSATDGCPPAVHAGEAARPDRVCCEIGMDTREHVPPSTVADSERLPEPPLQTLAAAGLPHPQAIDPPHTVARRAPALAGRNVLTVTSRLRN